MKQPEHYLPAPILTACHGPVVSQADALKAVETALSDAEKYKDLLLAALRRKPTTSQAPVV